MKGRQGYFIEQTIMQDCPMPLQPVEQTLRRYVLSNQVYGFTNIN